MDKEILNLVDRYLSQEIHLDDFQQRFARIYFQVRKSRNRLEPASRLCDEIVGPLAELSRGHRSEDSFRKELAQIATPLVFVFHNIQPKA